jgi:hypothetical protein
MCQKVGLAGLQCAKKLGWLACKAGTLGLAGLPKLSHWGWQACNMPKSWDGWLAMCQKVGLAGLQSSCIREAGLFAHCLGLARWGSFRAVSLALLQVWSFSAAIALLPSHSWCAALKRFLSRFTCGGAALLMNHAPAQLALDQRDSQITSVAHSVAHSGPV